MSHYYNVKLMNDLRHIGGIQRRLSKISNASSNTNEVTPPLKLKYLNAALHYACSARNDTDQY